MTAVADAGGAPAFAAVCLTPTIRQGLLARGAGFQACLEPLADTRFGHEQARVVGIGFDLLPQLADENSQVLDILALIAGPDFLQQRVMRHHQPDMRGRNMQKTIFF